MCCFCFLYTIQRHNSPTLQKAEPHQGRIKNSLMKQDPNEQRVAVGKKSIKVNGFSTREQLCVFVVGWCLPQYSVQFIRVSICICTCVSIWFYKLSSVISNYKVCPDKVLAAHVCVQYTWRWNYFLFTASAQQPSTSNPPRAWPEGGERMEDRTHTPVGLWLFLDKRPLAVLECRHVTVTNPQHMHANKHHTSTNSAWMHAHWLAHAC